MLFLFKSKETWSDWNLCTRCIILVCTLVAAMHKCTSKQLVASTQSYCLDSSGTGDSNILVRWWIWMRVTIWISPCTSLISSSISLSFNYRYTRFYVFPFVVWYSSIYESKDWLLQMERTLFPGSAQAMKLIFHGFLIVNVALNLVAFRRLLFHPHLHSVTSKARTQASAREQWRTCVLMICGRLENIFMQLPTV